MRHGDQYEDLKKVVMEFATNATAAAAGSGDAMQVGAVTKEEQTPGWNSPQEAGWENSELNALNRNTTCYNCGGKGHFSRDCPTAREGDNKGGKGGEGKGGKGGKGGDGGKGKGGQKGGYGMAPKYGVCYDCGGNHFARNCPNRGKGGGKGGKGGKGGSYRCLEQTWDDNWQGEVRQLSCVTCGEPDENDWQTVMTKSARKKQKKQETNETEEKVTRRWGKKGEKQVRMLQTVFRESVNTLGDGEWEEIELAVDSGATETVVSDEMLESVNIEEGIASKRGVEYEVANGVKIPNLGEKKFVGTSEDGIARKITAQVCEVNKALLSVKKVMAAGNRVVFDETGSYIEDKKSGERMWLREDKGLFMLKLWVKRAGF